MNQIEHMRKFIFILAAGAFASCGDSTDSNMNKINYPESRKVDQVDTLWGVEVEDPYRWLEDDRAPEVEQWVIDQNKTTRAYLDAIPEREEIRARYEELYNYASVGMPRKIGDKYYLTKNDGLQDQSVVYVRESIDGEDKVYLDPNLLSEDGTVTAALGGASKDGKYVVVVRNEAGSDWQQIRVLETETGEELGDVLDWVKFSGASWLGDGFFYSRYPEPDGSEFSSENTFHSVYFHKVGTPQSEDKLVFRNDDEPNRYHFVSVTEDEKFIVLNTSTGTDGNSLHVKSTDDLDGEWIELVGGFNHRSSIVGHHDGMFYFLTDIDAPRYKLVGVNSSLDISSKENWKDILPQAEDLLEGVSTSGGQLFATYLHNACSKVVQYNLDGSNPREFNVPGLGTTWGFYGKNDATETFYGFSSFTTPAEIYRLDLLSGESTLFAKPEVDFQPEDYETKQVWYESKDGTKVPMFIVHKKGLELNGQNTTLLYAYGGFNISLTPGFSASEIVFLERGGVYAMPNLRGGGEFGEEWHEAGMLLKKQNVFDDFISAAEYLIAEGYTSSEKLGIEGRSNGGLLIGAVMTQRPDLARVAFPGVGVMDMLRYHKFTIGWGWIPEYGCADSTEVDFQNLLAYSPVHNIKPSTHYPSTMVTTSDHDDRVVPAHSFKFAARLQECQASNQPALIRIEVNAGHGAGKPTSMILDEEADKWAFLLNETRD